MHEMKQLICQGSKINDFNTAWVYYAENVIWKEYKFSTKRIANFH